MNALGVALAFALTLAAATPLMASGTQSPVLDWLAGHWRSENGARVSEEIWSEPEGGLMLGMSRTIRDGKARGFEFLRIEIGAVSGTAGDGAGEGAALFAQPGGRPAVRFTLTSSAPNEATFENPDHDYPQRIVYSREGDHLTATISRIDGSDQRAFGWTLKTP